MHAFTVIAKNSAEAILLARLLALKTHEALSGPVSCRLAGMVGHG